MPKNDDPEVKKAAEKVGAAAKEFAKSLEKLALKRADVVKSVVKVSQALAEMGSGAPGLVEKGASEYAPAQLSYVREVQEQAGAETDCTRAQQKLDAAIKDFQKISSKKS
jgi:hypothetical protein